MLSATVLTLPPLKKRESARLRRLVKEWRKANPAGSRQRFLRYLADLDEPAPPLGDLAAAWRAYDEKRKIEAPVTLDDAIAVVMRAGLDNETGLDAYRYLVEVGAGNEDRLLERISEK